MDRRLSDLYTLPNPNGELDHYLLELRDQCARLEDQLLYAVEALPEDVQILLDSYISTRDELEFQSVKAALRFGKE